MDEPVDVVVVGAGPSGLSAATMLDDAGVDVVVLEARDRVGGRTRTIELDGRLVDVGAQWVGPDQHELRAILRRLDLATSPTPVRGRNVLLTPSGRREYRGTVPRLSLLQLLSLQRALTALDDEATRTHARVVAAPREIAAAGISVADHVRREGVRPEVVDLLRASMRVVFGAELEDVPLVAMLQYVRQAGGLMPLVDTAGGAQDARVVGGMQQVSQRLADGLGDRVRLGRPVVAVTRAARGVRVVHEDGAVESRCVVVAVPPNAAATWDLDVDLPRDRRRWLDGHVMGRTRKVQVRYERPFWRDEGFSGEAVWTHGPLSVVFDDTRPMGGYGLVGFVVGAPAADFASLGAEERRSQVLQRLAEAFGPRARSPSAYHEEEWHDDPYSGGCPVALPSSGSIPTGFDPIRPDGPVLWAGTETARRWRGFVDGAIEAGHRAAGQALVLVGRGGHRPTTSLRAGAR